MPGAARYGIRQIIEAASAYQDATGRRVSYEYAMIRDINDRVDQAKTLGELLAGRGCHVNLIPLNPGNTHELQPSRTETIQRFYDTLAHMGINATIRRSLGEDIQGACGSFAINICRSDKESSMRFVYGYFTHRGRVRQHMRTAFSSLRRDSPAMKGSASSPTGWAGTMPGTWPAVPPYSIYRNISMPLRQKNVQDNEAVSAYLVELIEGANRQVFEMAASDGSLAGMGTTLTFAWINGPEAYIVHVGDSRCYLIQDRQISQITKDHSLVQQLVDAGQIRESDMYVHPQKNIITKAVGTDRDVAPDIFMVSVKTGDILLLCTDDLSIMSISRTMRPL